MGDSRGANAFGRIFRILASDSVDLGCGMRAAEEIWPIAQEHDFCPEEMEADAALERLGLLRRVDGEPVYGPEDDDCLPESTLLMCECGGVALRGPGHMLSCSWYEADS